MKKIIALSMSLVLSIGLAGCGGEAPKGEQAASGEDYSYHWVATTTETEDYYMTRLTQEFIDMVSERTGGKVTGEVYADGQLGALVDALEALEMGNVDIVIDGISSLGVVDPLFDTWGLPYLYEDTEHKYNFWDTYGSEVVEMCAEVSNIRMACIVDGLYRELSCTKPVESLRDLKGLKIRVPSISAYVEIWESLGAAPIVMSFSEVYTAIQTGVVVGQENDVPLTLSANFFEICPYLIMTDHVAYEGAIMFNEETYQAFPEELKQIIKEVSAEITIKSRDMVQEEFEVALAKAEEMGVTVIRPDLTEFKEATAPMYEAYAYCEPVLKLIEEAKK